jgi:hypothetical protein
MNKTRRGLFALAMLSAGLSACTLPRARMIPDESIPHRVAVETSVSVYVRQTNGAYVIERVRLLPGWWVASPSVVK